MTAAHAERRGLLLAFAVFGVFWGSWSTVLPDVRERAGLGDGQLGLALAAVALAALPAMPLAGRLADRHGVRLLLPGALLAFAGAAALLAAAARPAALVGALVVLGLVTGALDVVLNAAAAAWERRTGGRLLALAHAGFSLGVLAGAVLTGLARDRGAGPPAVLLAVAAVLAGAALAQPRHRQAPVAAARAVDARGRLPLVLGLLGMVVASAFLVEDALQSWSALHLERDLGAPPWVGGLGPGLFAGAMAAGRLGAHLLARPGREAATVATGGGVLAAGALLLALAPAPAPALVGAALAGAGVSVLAPPLLSAVGARSAPGRQGADLALVTALGYGGFLLGPVAVGLVSGATGLTTALALLAPVALLTGAGGAALLSRHAGAAPPVRGRPPVTTTPRS